MRFTRFSLIVVSLCIFVALAPAYTFSLKYNRIIGGEEVKSGSYPYIVSLRLDNTHVCGGSILSDSFILTAAHCLYEKGSNTIVDVKRFSVRVGSINQYAGGKIVYVSDLIVHPQYKNFKNDIAIVKLTEKLIFNAKISMIPFATTTADVPPTGADITVAGWGEQGEDVTPYKLHGMIFKVATEADCLNAFPQNDESTICLDHELKRGSCIGDAGNGAVYNKQLIGVSNFIIGACGSRYPDVFINVVHFSKWINETINV